MIELVLLSVLFGIVYLAFGALCVIGLVGLCSVIGWAASKGWTFSDTLMLILVVGALTAAGLSGYNSARKYLDARPAEVEIRP